MTLLRHCTDYPEVGQGGPRPYGATTPFAKYFHNIRFTVNLLGQVKCLILAISWPRESKGEGDHHRLPLPLSVIYLVFFTHAPSQVGSSSVSAESTFRPLCCF